MRVWIVNPYDNLPVEGYRKERYWLMAEAFVRTGGAVTYWTQDFSHANKARRRAAAEPGTAIDLRMLPVPEYPSNICLRRVWSHLVFARRWFAAARDETARPDLVVTSSPPLLIGRAVRRFCAETGTKYVLDVMDAWPETFERLGAAFRLSGVGALMRGIVRANYRGAAAVTCVARRYAEMVTRDYGVTAPVKLVHHGIELRGGADARERRKNGPFRLAYAGNMSLSYDLRTVVEAVKADESLALDLAGRGPDEADLRERAAGCARIRFHGYLGETALRELLTAAEAGVVPMFDESCVGVPYKLADYAAAGLPVLCSLHGETQELLEEHGAGIVYEAGDAAAFRKAAAACRDRAERLSSGMREVAGLFDAERLYKEYVDFVSGL